MATKYMKTVEIYDGLLLLTDSVFQLKETNYIKVDVSKISLYLYLNYFSTGKQPCVIMAKNKIIDFY